mgnify:CR=1 FL=1
MNASRIFYIDALKAIAIVLVVMGRGWKQFYVFANIERVSYAFVHGFKWLCYQC